MLKLFLISINFIQGANVNDNQLQALTLLQNRVESLSMYFSFAIFALFCYVLYNVPNKKLAKLRLGLQEMFSSN